MTKKFMATINFAGSIDYYEVKDYEFCKEGMVILTKFDGSKVIVGNNNVMIEIIKE